MDEQRRRANESVLSIDRYIDTLYLEGRVDDLKELTKDPQVHIRVMAKAALRNWESAMERKGWKK